MEWSIGLVEVEGVDRKVMRQLEELKEHLISKLRTDVVAIAESF